MKQFLLLKTNIGLFSMVIREAGLLLRGFTLIKASYHKTSGDEIDTDLRSALLTALLNFAESAFSSKIVEYLEFSEKFVIAFTDDKIQSIEGNEPEALIAYAILDKEKKIDKVVSNVIVPSLKEMLNQFILKYSNRNLSEMRQFDSFRKIIDEIFGLDVKTIDQRAKGLFS